MLKSIDYVAIRTNSKGIPVSAQSGTIIEYSDEKILQRLEHLKKHCNQLNFHPTVTNRTVKTPKVSTRI